MPILQYKQSGSRHNLIGDNVTEMIKQLPPIQAQYARDMDLYLESASTFATTMARKFGWTDYKLIVLERNKCCGMSCGCHSESDVA